jgi:hypothetical protein
MNSKKLITLLVLLTLIVGMMPIGFVSAALSPLATEQDGDAIPGGGPPYTVDKGDKIAIVGDAGEVASGQVVEIYWDDSTIAWNGEKGKLNESTADSDGSYEIWFKVPEATNGDHYVWAKSGTLDPESVEFDVITKVDNDANSGLEGDRIDVDVYGLGGNKDTAFFMADGDTMTAWAWTALGAPESLGTGVELDGTLDNTPLAPGSVVLTDTGGAPIDPVVDNAGNLYYDDNVNGYDGTDVKIGTINYVTGAYDLDYDEASVSPSGTVTADYDYYVETPDQLYLFSTAQDSNSLGSVSKRVEIPDWTEGVMYYIAVMDSKGNYGTDDFTIGAVIELSVDEGEVGRVVRITGRGFTDTGGIDIPEAIPDEVLGGTAGVGLTDGVTYWVARILDYDPLDPPEVGGDGEFRIDVFVPDTDEEDDDFYFVVNDGTVYATADFEVTDLPSIEADPSNGPQGSKITVTGENFPNEADTEVYIYVYDQNGNAYERGVNDWGAWDDDFNGKEIEVESDGSFEEEVRIPTQTDGTYDLVVVYWDRANEVNMDAVETFRIGSILVLLSDDEGPSGMDIVMTGNGFSDSKSWNATFAGEELVDDLSVSGDGLISTNFYVPQKEPGVYDIVVMDIETEITVTVEFEVTAATMLEVTPSEAPTGYNISLDAYNWPETEQDWDIIFYNATEDGLLDEDWEITNDVWSWIGDPPAKLAFMAVNEDGEAHGWWILEQPNGDELSKGTYYLNVSNTDDFFVQTMLVVGDVHEYIAPRKATFRIGDTVSFALQHSFGNVLPGDDGKIYGGVVKVWDPDGELYWETDELEDWTDMGLYWAVTAAHQTAATNPMVLLDDAPLGTWTYKWYENSNPGDEEVLGQGSFNVAAAAEEILSEQIEDLNTAINDLTDDVSSVTDAVAGVQSNVNSAIAAANAAVEAANAAVDAVNSVAGTASQAAEAAQNAAAAAENAQNAASGLTTLVYGAIGASLVAALAAIVSLMQISRRIAG